MYGIWRRCLWLLLWGWSAGGNTLGGGAPSQSSPPPPAGDIVPPVLTVIRPVPGATVTRLTTVELLFSEPVRGVDAADLRVNAAAAHTVTGAGSGPYRFTFLPPEEGAVQLSWAADPGITDVAETPNLFAGAAWTNTVTSAEARGTALISELLANNAANLTNEFGETADWIEVFNPGSNTVHLLGWSLTDDPAQLGRWTFPDLRLGPGEYLVVFADDRDSRSLPEATQLHTNFKLNDQGDYLALCSADFPPTPMVALAPQFPEQRPDYSYGLSLTNVWSYFPIPTPGAGNAETGLIGITPPPQINATRGFYEQPFTLRAWCALTEAQIRFTTNGSTPTELNGRLYTTPWIISNTTILRLAAFAPGRLPSRVWTHSFLFPDQVVRQRNTPQGFPAGNSLWGGYPTDYGMDPEIVTNQPSEVRASLLALPTLSIALALDDLFGPANGIYTHPAPPPDLRELWERACSAEFILTNGQTGFQVDCGVRVHGNASRLPLKTPKHSFRLFFRGAYGPGRLDYALFPDSPVRSFDSLVLRADYNNSWLHWDPDQRLRGSLIRDAWAKKTLEAMNGMGGHSRPFHLYLNGLYWGVYSFGERIDAEFAAAYLGGQPNAWDAITSRPVEAINGDLAAYNTLIKVGRDSDLTQPANYLLLQQLLDLPVFLDYMILNFYGANLDWSSDGNWNALCQHAPGATFKYLLWDGEQFLVHPEDNRVASTDLPSGLHTNLVRSPEYRLQFADRVQRYCFLNGLLTPGPAADRWHELALAVAPGVLAESARWGDYRRDVHPYAEGPYDLYTTNQHWWPEIERLRTHYFPARTAIFLQQLRSAGLYPDIPAPTFSQQGGLVPADFSLSLAHPCSIHYTTDGSDPRLPFSGAVAPEARLYTGPLTVTSNFILKARARNGTNWSALNEAFFQLPTLAFPLHLTELMYNPLGGEAYEFVELRLDGSMPLDVSGWSFLGISFVFPPGTVLTPGQIILLANNADPAAFATRYPGRSVFGYYGGKLSNEGERIALLDRTGRILCSVDYGNTNGWPAEADGQGYSLEVIDPFGDPDAPSNWRAAALHGTPGTPPADTGIEPVRLNEMVPDHNTVMKPSPTFPSALEIHNSSAGEVNLTGWSVSNDSNPRKCVFPDQTRLGPDGYLVVWCNGQSALPGLHANLSLDPQGGTVSLWNSNTSRVDVLTYHRSLPGYSLGRVAQDWVLNIPTPGQPNSPAPAASPTALSLNEWLANPSIGSDWIELLNTAPEPVPLRGLVLAVNHGLHQLQALAFLEPGGCLPLFADALPGPNHLDFTLPANGDQLVLYDGAAHELDRITYGPQRANTSEGRLPDGGTGRAFFPCPTPGASNTFASTLFLAAEPVSQAVPVGVRATFSATAAGGGTLAYQWLFNDHVLPGAQAATLTLEPVGFNDAGDYSVVISNACATVTSAPAALIVGVPPTITVQPASRTNTAGEFVRFQLLATSPLPVTYQWRWYGSDLEGETNAILELGPIGFAQAGPYRALVVSSSGAVSSSAAHLTVVEPPLLSVPVPRAEGGLQFTLLRGQPFRSYLIETSADLRGWSNLFQVDFTHSPENLIIPLPTRPGLAFFRARLLP